MNNREILQKLVDFSLIKKKDLSYFVDDEKITVKNVICFCSSNNPFVEHITPIAEINKLSYPVKKQVIKTQYRVFCNYELDNFNDLLEYAEFYYNNSAYSDKPKTYINYKEEFKDILNEIDSSYPPIAKQIMGI